MLHSVRKAELCRGRGGEGRRGVRGKGGRVGGHRGVDTGRSGRGGRVATADLELVRSVSGVTEDWRLVSYAR